MDKNFLGEGAYGKVISKNNKAHKNFKYLSHLIQEYTVLKYLKTCKHIVHVDSVNFENLEISMELYDCNLRQWLNNNNKNVSDIKKIIRDILLGLIEIHDRGMAHGDLKPTNILIKLNPLKAVIGDCGFSSIAKYSKVERTAPGYKEPDISFHSTHDMFSLGICLLQLLYGIRVRKPNYNQLKRIVDEKVTNNTYHKIISSLLDEDKSKRLTSREVYSLLFTDIPEQWTKPLVSSEINIPEPERQIIKNIFNDTCRSFNINRGVKGYKALLIFLNNKHIPSKNYKLYVATTIMILSSLFGESGFRENDIIRLCSNISKDDVYKVLEELLSDELFINGLLTPPKH